MDDLDKFKEDPEGFVKMVDYAVDSFKEKKEQKALYKKIYEDGKCLVTMPKGPEGAAAAGSFCKVNGEVRCPWCVCVKYPENEKWWKQYEAAALAFIYSKENGVVTDACCVLLTASDALSIIEDGSLAYSQVEGLENIGLNDKPVEQRKVLKRLYRKTGLTDNRLVKILRPSLESKERDFKAVALGPELFAASESGDTERVREFLEAGANVNVKNNEGCTPLHLAASYGHPDTCEALINAGADVNTGNDWKETPLLWAARAGHLETCKLLIDAGADVCATSATG